MANTQNETVNILITRDGMIDEELHGLLDAAERREQLRAYGHEIMSTVLHRTAQTALAVGKGALMYLEAAAEAGRESEH